MFKDPSFRLLVDPNEGLGTEKNRKIRLQCAKNAKETNHNLSKKLISKTIYTEEAKEEQKGENNKLWMHHFSCQLYMIWFLYFVHN